MPRHVQSLLYGVPERLLPNLAPGSLVSIPFLKKEIFALVTRITESPDGIPEKKLSNVKPILNCVGEGQFLTVRHLSFIRTVAEHTGASYGTVAGLLLPPLQKRKLASLRLAPAPAQSQSRSPSIPAYYAYATPDQHGEALRRAIRGRTLVLVPEARHISQVIDLLPHDTQSTVTVWHGEKTTRQQFEIWRRVRAGESGIIVGTRGSVFLPFPSLDAVIIDFEHDDNHKHWGETPRFHAKDIAEMLSLAYGADLARMSFSQSVESYYHVHKGFYASYNLQSSTSPTARCSMSVVDMADERRGGNYGIFSNQLLEEIRKAPGDICLYINKKGSAGALVCSGCGNVVRCASCTIPMGYAESERMLRCFSCGANGDIPAHCPACRGSIMKFIGAGTESVERDIRRMFGGSLRHKIFRIDTDDAEIPDIASGQRLLIGTDRIFRHARWHDTRLFAFLDLDRALSIPDMRAGERMLHHLHEALFHLPADARCLAQTANPAHMVVRALSEPDRWYRTELHLRRSLGYPPYAYHVRFLYGHASRESARIEAARFSRELSAALTPSGIGGILRAPVALQPEYARGKYWQMILASYPLASRDRAARAAYAVLPPSWLVDPHPISLLSL